jgi:hypothetical protein
VVLSFAIIAMGFILFRAVGRLEPNRRLATIIKCALVVTGAMAVVSQMIAGQ